MQIKQLLSLLALATLVAVPVLRAADDPVALGKQVVEKNRCTMCHALDGKGGKMGKPLNGISKGLTDDHIRASVIDPKSVLGDKVKKPGFKGKISDAELDAVVAYLRSIE